MKDWFASLESREQTFVLAGATVVVVALIYALLWLPLDSSHREASASVDAWQRSLAELRPLRPLAAQAQASGSTVVTSSQQSPIIVVDQTLRSRGLEQFRRRSQPTANNGIRVEFENVAFDDLVLWLGDLGQYHGMHVQAGSLSVASQSGPGRINASLTLERTL